MFCEVVGQDTNRVDSSHTAFPCWRHLLKISLLRMSPRDDSLSPTRHQGLQHFWTFLHPAPRTAHHKKKLRENFEKTSTAPKLTGPPKAFWHIKAAFGVGFSLFWKSRCRITLKLLVRERVVKKETTTEEKSRAPKFSALFTFCRIFQRSGEENCAAQQLV